MTVTAPAGFEAAGHRRRHQALAARSTSPLIVNRGPSNAAAAVFTTNRAKANPILWSEQVIADGTGRGDRAELRRGELLHRARGVPGHASHRRGGGRRPRRLRRRRARLLDRTHRRPARRRGARGGRALGRSTGCSRRRRRRRRARDHDDRHACRRPSSSSGDGWRIGGIAKGAGMLAPGPRDDARRAHDRRRRCASDDARRGAPRRDPGHLRPARLRRLHVDERPGHAARASGASGVVPDARRVHRRRSPRPAATSRCSCRTTPRAPATTSRSRSRGAATEDDAVEVGRSVARNNLFKAAIFGNDPNWGRVLAAIGTTQAAVRPVPRRRLDERGARLPRRPARRAARAGRPRRRAPRTCSSSCTPARHPPRSSPTTSRTTTCTRTARTRAEHGDANETRSPRAGERCGRTRGASRPQVLIESLPWLKRFHGEIDRREVRRQRDGERRAAARVRRGHGLPALRGHQARRRARRRTADLRDARAARHRERVPRRLPRHDARDDGRRAHGALGPGEPRARVAHQRARAARRRPLR